MTAAPPALLAGPATSSEVAALPAIQVQGSVQEEDTNGLVARQAEVGSKTRSEIEAIPQSVSVVTRGQIEAQQPLSTSQALRYTAGANSERFGGFGTQLDITRIRGIDADYYLDGLRVISNVSTWTPQIDPYTLQSIEVLRGPSSVLYGQGTGGGVIDQRSRLPQKEAAHEVMARVGSYRHREVGLDSTGAIDEDGVWRYRLTLTGLDANGQVEGVHHKRVYLAPSLSWHPSAATRWTLLATHVREPDIPDYNSLPAVALGLDGSPYRPVDRRRNYTDMDFQASSRKQDSVTSLFEHRFDNGLTFNSRVRYMYINSDIQRTSIYGYQDRHGRLWLEGTYGLAPSTSHTWQMDNTLSGDLDLGPTEHRWLLGVDAARGKISNDSYRMDPVAFDPYDPQAHRPQLPPDFSDSRKNWPYNVRQDFSRVGIYAQDQIALGRWRLTLGGRYDWSRVDDRSRSYSPQWNTSRQTDTKWSGRAGLNYLFDNGVAPYISYATSFDPVLGNNFHGQPFAPTEATQSEIGVKYLPPDSDTQLSAALFQLEQTNVKTADTQHLGYWTQSGEVRSRGLELQANAGLAPGLRLLAGYVYLHNRLRKDNTYPGKSLTQTPAHTASAWLDYQVPGQALAGLRLGLGMRYLGSSWGNPANTFKVPAATLVDAAISYELGKPARGTTLALNVSNLANKQYVASCSSQMYCFIGQDRLVTATVTTRW